MGMHCCSGNVRCVPPGNQSRSFKIQINEEMFGRRDRSWCGSVCRALALRWQNWKWISFHWRVRACHWSRLPSTWVTPHQTPMLRWHQNGMSKPLGHDRGFAYICCAPQAPRQHFLGPCFVWWWVNSWASFRNLCLHWWTEVPFITNFAKLV